MPALTGAIGVDLGAVGHRSLLEAAIDKIADVLTDKGATARRDSLKHDEGHIMQRVAIHQFSGYGVQAAVAR